MVGLFNMTIRSTTPVLLAALGGAFTYHAGVINVAMEGLMLSSAFFSVVFSYMFGNPFIAIVGGVLSAIILSLIYSAFVDVLKANNFAIGFGINIFVASLTLFLMRILFTGEKAFTSPSLASIPELPLKTGIVYLDESLFGYSLLTYLAIGLVFLISYIFYSSTFGLYLRVSGEKPSALDDAGVSTRMIRLYSSIMCGLLCGLAGSQLSLYNVSMFTRNMTAGRGFVALAAILATKGRPKFILLLTLVFGLVESLSLNLQAYIPSQLTTMWPYVVTILLIIVFAFKKKKSKSSVA